MLPNHNGYPKTSILSITVIGSIGLLGTAVICILNPDNAMVLSSIIGGMVTTLIGFIMVLTNQKRQEDHNRRQEDQNQQIIIHTNSIVEQLVKAAKERGHADGVLAEQEAEKGRRNDRKDEVTPNVS